MKRRLYLWRVKYAFLGHHMFISVWHAVFQFHYNYIVNNSICLQFWSQEVEIFLKNFIDRLAIYTFFLYYYLYFLYFLIIASHIFIYFSNFILHLTPYYILHSAWGQKSDHFQIRTPQLSAHCLWRQLWATRQLLTKVSVIFEKWKQILLWRKKSEKRENLSQWICSFSNALIFL